MKRILLIVFLNSLIMNVLLGQRSISGRITDAETGEPISGVSVFIANTTIGTATDPDGKYRLVIQGEGSYRLAVSHIGYQPVFKDIEPGNQSIVHDVAMLYHEIEEVTVAAKIQFRRTDINLFWQTLLGKSPSKNTIYAVNPEDVYYFYNSQTRILKVTCRSPLQIINNETGYRIQLALDHFTHDYKTNISSWNYEYQFIEIEPAHNKQKNIWDANRKKNYQVSLANFIKALYNNSLMDNGYLLTYIDSRDAAGNLRNVYAENPTAFLSVDAIPGSKVFHIPHDMNNLALICFGRPVKQSDLIQNESPALRTFNWTRIGLLRNIIKTPSGQIRIFPDGTYSEPPILFPFMASNSLLGLNLKLPLDYISDNKYETMLSVAETDEIIDEDEITKRFELQLAAFPQEKIHLHTDRDFYVPGEKIWFKAYVADAVTHLPQTLSRYVYVELISPVDTLISRVMVRPEDGMFYGHMPLMEIVPEGNYTLRAYTRYMENLGDDYFFKKNIRITPLDTKRGIETKNQKPETRNPKPETVYNDFDVSFFPEGGNLVEGAVCKTAFKALNRDGTSEHVNGEIVDDTGAVLTSVETVHAGMGVFFFQPEPEKRYFLLCRNSHGVEKRFSLPQSNPRAYTLAVSQRNGRIAVEIRKSAGNPELSGYLLAHCRGMVLHFSTVEKANQITTFLEEDLPAGIIKLVLFDEQMNPVSERLVFNKNKASETLTYKTDKTTYTTREKVVTTLSLSNLSNEAITSIEHGETIMGHFSIAITDDKDVTVDATTTLPASLLLSSELKGYIENPAWYLQDNMQSAIALDYLMLTHGWRRYNVPEVVNGKPQLLQIPFQTGQTITGSVKSTARSQPVSDGEVMIIAEGDFGLTTTDESGNFVFRDFEYPDSTSYFIQARNRRGSSLVEPVLDAEIFPKLLHAPQSYVVPDLTLNSPLSTLNSSTAFLEKAEQRSKYDEDMRVIYLDEVVVSAPRIVRREESRLDFWANIDSDNTIRREDIEKWRPRNVTDMMRKIPGVIVDPNGKVFFARSMVREVLPYILIDGVPAPWEIGEKGVLLDSPLEHVNINDIESIDIIKGAGAAMFGTRGGGGAISITTTKAIDEINRRKQNGNVPEINQKKFNPLGYQKPVAFYSPKYETLEAKYQSIPDYRTTIFWKPDVVISTENGTTSFEFYTSDVPTTYSVVIEGLTVAGKIIRQVEKINVE